MSLKRLIMVPVLATVLMSPIGCLYPHHDKDWGPKSETHYHNSRECHDGHGHDCDRYDRHSRRDDGRSSTTTVAPNGTTTTIIRD